MDKASKFTDFIKNIVVTINTIIQIQIETLIGALNTELYIVIYDGLSRLYFSTMTCFRF